MSNLSGKHIILGISGGIAAYKSVTLLRLLVKAGAEVQVVITPNGKEFITPVTLSSLSGKPVVSEFFTANTGEWHSHVDLGLWADAMIIAPATASTLAKMANGVADNMLITTYLSAKAPVFVAPAMDLDMMAHPSTTRNLRTLQADGVTVIEPEVGELASHLVGRGRMEEPEKIAAVLDTFFASGQTAEGQEGACDGGADIRAYRPGTLYRKLLYRKNGLCHCCGSGTKGCRCDACERSDGTCRPCRSDNRACGKREVDDAGVRVALRRHRYRHNVGGCGRLCPQDLC